jgi:hypothetical protein
VLDDGGMDGSGRPQKRPIMFSAAYDFDKPPTLTTGVLMVPEEAMKAMQAEVERLRAALKPLAMIDSEMPQDQDFVMVPRDLLRAVSALL